MTLDAVTFGEALVNFVAQESGDLAHVSTFKRVLAGAEVNVAIGLARLGHETGWSSRLGDDPFGRFALAELAAAGVDTQTVALDADAPTAFQLKSARGRGRPRDLLLPQPLGGPADRALARDRHVHRGCPRTCT